MADKKAKSKFPETLLVTQEKDGDDTYLNTYESLDEVPEDAASEQVAEYKLVGVKKLSVTKTLS